VLIQAFYDHLGLSKADEQAGAEASSPPSDGLAAASLWGRQASCLSFRVQRRAQDTHLPPTARMALLRSRASVSKSYERSKQQVQTAGILAT